MSKLHECKGSEDAGVQIEKLKSWWMDVESTHETITKRINYCPFCGEKLE